MACRRCGYRSCGCGLTVKTKEEIEAMTRTNATAMSAPSKEEAIEARIKRARGPMPDICDKTIVALADENERLRKNLEIAEQSRDSWKADRERLVGENERLRAENEKLMADALVRQTTEITLRADLDDCRRVIEMKRADEPLWDKLGEIASGIVESDGKPKAAQNIERDKLRAERAECLALLEESEFMLEQADEIIRESDGGIDADEVGYAPLVTKLTALVAKLRGQS